MGYGTSTGQCLAWEMHTKEQNLEGTHKEDVMFIMFMI